MADNYKKLGAGGVDLVRSKYAPDDATVVEAQNAELVFDKALSGRNSLRKRSGLVSNGAAFSGGVFGMFEIKFADGADLTPDVPPGGTETHYGSTVTYNDGWDDELGQHVVNCQSIDEVGAANDADYITSSTPAGELNNLNIQTDVLTGSGVLTAATVRIRAKFTDLGGAQGQELTVIVSDNGVSPVTILDTQVGPNPLVTGAGLTTAFQTFELDVFDYGYASAPLTGNVLNLGFVFDGMFTTNPIVISWIEVELTFA